MELFGAILAQAELAEGGFLAREHSLSHFRK